MAGKNNQWKVEIWGHHDRTCFSQFPSMNITQICLTGYFWFIFNHNDWTTWEFLFSINFRYIHLLFNFFEGQKQEESFCFSASPAFHTSTCSKLWEARDLPYLFHVSSWPSHLWKSQMEWPILDCGKAFPLHGEVMENSPSIQFHWYNNKVRRNPDTLCSPNRLVADNQEYMAMLLKSRMFHVYIKISHVHGTPD